MAFEGESGMNSVLIVDNEQANLEFLSKILSDEYFVYTVDNGQEAIKTAMAKRPDVILVDADMPDMSGRELIAALRSLRETKEIPVIILLEIDSFDEEEEDFLYGAVDYIQKPLPSVVVKSRLRNYMRVVNQRRILDQMEGLDKATGVFSAKFFQTRLGQEWRRAMRDGSYLSLLMLGVDDWNTYNEDQRDGILKDAAAVIKNSLKRPMDLLARWEDELFVVILPNTPEYGASVVAEMIRVNIEKTSFQEKDPGGPVPVTISISVNSINPEMNSIPKDFFSLALVNYMEHRQEAKNSVRIASQ